MSTEQLIPIEALSEGQQEIVEVIGLGNYIKMVLRFGGNNLYIQKYSEISKPSRDKEIIEKFNGYNYTELATEYNLSTRTIYKLVSSLIRQKKNAPLEDQMKFF